MEQQLTQIDPILRLAQTSKRPVREDVEGSVAKVYRNLGTISARSLQAICGSEWCAEWKPSGNGMTLYVGNGAALPSQPEIHQVSAADCLNAFVCAREAWLTPFQRGKPNVRGSMIVDCAHAERLVGSTASEFLATPKAHDILLDTDGFR